MPVSAVVDTVIGLSFVFFVLSLAASAIAEWVATVLKKRAKYLMRGLRALLDGPGVADPGTRMTAALRGTAAERALLRDAVQVLDGARPSALDITPWGRFLGHPLVAAQAQRRADGVATRPPSYLAASTVSATILDEFLGGDPDVLLSGKLAAGSIPEPLGSTLTAMAHQAEGSVATFTTAIENWYDAQMARISGGYKRWIKRWIAVISVAIVLVFHVDAFSLAGTLWSDQQVREAVAAIASPTVCDAQKNDTQAYLSCLDGTAAGLSGAGLAIGFPAGCAVTDVGACLLPHRDGGYRFPDALIVFAGLLLSVLAATLGAPFWFQVLTRLASLRNTGDKPEPGT